MSLRLINLFILSNLNRYFINLERHRLCLFMLFFPAFFFCHRANNSFFEVFSTRSNSSVTNTNSVKLALCIRRSCFSCHRTKPNYERETRVVYRYAKCRASSTWKMTDEKKRKKKNRKTHSTDTEHKLQCDSFVCLRFSVAYNVHYV